MITLDNFQKVKESMPVITQQVDMKATGATIHTMRTQLQLLDASIWYLSQGRQSEHYLAVANEARKHLATNGVHFAL